MTIKGEMMSDFTMQPVPEREDGEWLTEGEYIQEREERADREAK